jgi:hypothetical protein
MINDECHGRGYADLKEEKEGEGGKERERRDRRKKGERT